MPPHDKEGQNYFGNYRALEARIRRRVHFVRPERLNLADFVILESGQFVPATETNHNEQGILGVDLIQSMRNDPAFNTA